ncbi:hypothetical protein TorRG33x02_106870 [Trema orientale]|uniref:Uncharacterized protein n=1 Tax=Trema orientale TaxID=63057 RepID=A0A2P5F6L2_TREOI|nr:hypothetical protein TorRG33x02_106870 [Trema orientale]
MDDEEEDEVYEAIYSYHTLWSWAFIWARVVLVLVEIVNDVNCESTSTAKFNYSNFKPNVVI